MIKPITLILMLAPSCLTATPLLEDTKKEAFPSVQTVQVQTTTPDGEKKGLLNYQYADIRLALPYSQQRLPALYKEIHVADIRLAEQLK